MDSLNVTPRLPPQHSRGTSLVWIAVSQLDPHPTCHPVSTTQLGSVRRFSHFRSSSACWKVVGLKLFCFWPPWGPGAKLPSRKASSHFSRPSASRAPNNVRQALRQTPSSSHCFSRRQHAAGDWILVQVKTATPPRFVEPTECIQSTPGLIPQGQVPGAKSPPVFAYRKLVEKTVLPVCRQGNSEDESRRKLKLAWGINGARQLAVRRPMTRRH
jgi:hypothetical protein